MPTLLDRTLDLLAEGPAPAERISREVLGLPQAPPAVSGRLVFALLGADPRVSQLGDGRWALVPAARGAPALEECAFAVVDVETTGMRAAGDRVIEVGIVVVHGERRELVVDRLVQPGRPVPWGVTRVTRITDGDLAGAPAFGDVADEIQAALAGRVFVAHNARFDWAFLSAEFRRSRGHPLIGPRLCTARLARRLVPGAESCGLDWLSTWFGLENPARHRAGGDAWATAGLLLRLLDLARRAGLRTLGDLEDPGKR
jgi:DNA polymerase-3 subunit epsilon